MARTTLEDLRVQHERLRERQGKSPQTTANERSTCRRMCAKWDATRRAPSSLNDTWMEDYLYGEDGMAGKVSPNSFNKQLIHLSTFVKWLVRREVVSGDVLDVMTKLDVEQKRYPRLSMGAMHQMIQDAADPWERFVLGLGIHSLGRWSELRFIQRQHVHLDGGYIEWYRQKTREWDEIPITAELDAELRRWIVAYEKVLGSPLEPHHYMIPLRNPAGWRTYHWAYLPEQQASESIRTCVKKHSAPYLGGMDAIRGQGVHILRRAAARELYEALKRAGVADPLRIVMTMLGHKNVRTSEIYLGIERDRETRDTLLRGASLLSVDTTNVVELKVVGNGD